MRTTRREGARAEASTVALEEYAGAFVVVKLGGAAMGEPGFLRRVARSVSALVDRGAYPVLVHGGGPDITAFAERLGIEARFVKGRRVTDAATLEAVQLVLCGKTNKEVVAALCAEGLDALGLSGLDAELLVARPLDPELGFVGEVAEVNVPLLSVLAAQGYVPVIAPLCAGLDGHRYNVNADEASAAVAQALNAAALVLLTDVDGLYARHPDPASLLRQVTAHEAERLVQEGKVSSGMLPKVTASVQAADGGVPCVVMANGALDAAVERALRGETGTRVTKG